MRIHTNTLTRRDLYEAAEVAERRCDHGAVSVHQAEEHGSRTHAAAYEVTLVGDGTYSGARTQRFSHLYAASWESWGAFLAELWRRDPTMRTSWYTSEDVFHEITHGAFRPGVPITTVGRRSRARVRARR
jgi:hypothetical protein